MRAPHGSVCGSCGAPAPYLIILRGQPVPACLRHLNVWRTPPADYTCPTECVEQNHPGREHHEWLSREQSEAATTEALAEAWDKGLKTGIALAERGFASPNPYRVPSTSEGEGA